MPTINISPYSPEHRDDLRALDEAVRRDEDARKPLGASADRPADRRFVATVDGAVVAGVDLRSTEHLSGALTGLNTSTADNHNPAVVEISGLRVHPGFRGLGIGRRLLDAATRAGWELGHQPVVCIPRDDEAALVTLRSKGWEMVSDDAETVVLRAPLDMSGVTGFVRAGVRPGDTGAVATGIEVSTTFSMSEPGRPGEFDYARAQNPTRQALEEALATAEAGRHAMAFSSGLAAIDTVLRLLSPGDRVMLGTDAYGGTWRLLDKVWSRVGVEVDVVDVTDPAAVVANWRISTRMVIIETPSNPTLAVADIAALADVVHARGAWLVVDNTFATPWLQRPLSLGADIVVHSATKYLGGHSDVVAGALATDDDALAAEFRFSQKAIGAVPGPFDSFLVLRGLRTLPLRMERHCSNAAAVAAMLAEHPAVAQVHYPGLPSDPGFAAASRQMRGFGGMVSFVLAGGEDAARETAMRTRLFTLAESLGAVESLIEHPASMTHAANSGSLLEVDPALVRLSVGIEDVWALLADLRQALPA